MLIDRGQIYKDKVVLGCLPKQEYDGLDAIDKNLMTLLMQDKVKLDLNLFYYMYTKDKKWYYKFIDNLFNEYITWYGTSSNFMDTNLYILDERYLNEENYQETNVNKVGIYEKKLSLSLQQNVAFFSRKEIEEIIFSDLILKFKDICKENFNYEFKELDDRNLKPYGYINVFECYCVDLDKGYSYISSHDMSDLINRFDMHNDDITFGLEQLKVFDCKEFNYDNSMEEFERYVRAICRISLDS